MASAEEEELGGLLLNGIGQLYIQTTLYEIGCTIQLHQ